MNVFTSVRVYPLTLTMRFGPCLILTIGSLLGCGASMGGAASNANARGGGSMFDVVAEGPCGKLSIAATGSRRFIVYGDTGYDLRDWTAGDRLAAAESLVEVRGAGTLEVGRNPRWLAGLPTNSGGYVAADLELGARPDGGAFLLTIDTTYAARSRGALLAREASAWTLGDGGWIKSSSSDAVVYPERAASLPPIPEAQLCHGAAERFVRITSTALATGDVFIAGRCQDQSHVNAPNTLAILYGSPGAKTWTITALPDARALDGIVNVSLYARSAHDTYLAAWEPMTARADRKPYLAHFDGRQWAQEETAIPGGLMSLGGTSNGTLYVAAGTALYRRDKSGAAWNVVPMPPLRFSEAPASAVWIHAVRALADHDIWVEGTYRVRVGQDKEGRSIESRASVLYHYGAPMTPLWCDAREPAEKGLVEVTQ